MYNLETVSDELCLFGVTNVHFNEEIFVPIWYDVSFDNIVVHLYM